MNKSTQITKVALSITVIVLLSTVALIRKKDELIVETIKPKNSFGNSVNQSHIYISNDYGTVTRRSNSAISNAIVEHIELNVPKKADSAEKITRHGCLVRYPKAEGTILICHGFMCDKYDVGFLRHLFPEGRFNFMTFDFRAHGQQCCGQRCTFGRDEALDVITAGHFLKEHPGVSGKPLIVYGFSMGAVAAIEAQARDNSLFTAMVLDCPFDSSENVIKKSLESIQLTFFGYEFNVPASSLLQRYAFHPYVQNMLKGLLKTVSNLDFRNIDIRMYPISPVVSIQKVNVPCFFIHCKNDEKISVGAVKSIYEGAGSKYKKLWLTNGRRHFDSYFYNPEKYIKEIRLFIDNVVIGTALEDSLQQMVEDQDELLI